MKCSEAMTSALALFFLIDGPARAQSSATLYGLLDTGITYTNNTTSGNTHGAALQLQSGVSAPERWGLLGREDLGGGQFVTFRVENGFQTSNGASAVTGEAFSLQSYVALGGNWGTVTLGRQYDFAGDVMPAYAVAANTPAGLLAWSLPSYAAGEYVLDNRVWGLEVDNAVKYVTPSMGGFTAGAMYGFGNVPGSVVKSSTSSYLLSYDNGKLSAALVYYGQRDVATGGNVRDFVGGVAYTFGDLRISGLASDVQISSGNKPRATTYEAGATYQLTAALQIGGGFQFQKRNNNVGSANQTTVAIDYFLSKRTDVYAVAALGHEHGYGAQVEAGLGSNSTTSTQTAVRVGVKHSF